MIKSEVMGIFPVMQNISVSKLRVIFDKIINFKEYFISGRGYSGLATICSCINNII